MNFDGFRYNMPLTCRGILNDEYPPDLEFPIFDYECSDFPYVIYPNKLKFQMELNEDRSLMVALHNHNQKGMEFKWQT